MMDKLQEIKDKMRHGNQQDAYEWAKKNLYQSVAARYAHILACMVDEKDAEIERQEVLIKQAGELLHRQNAVADNAIAEAKRLQADYESINEASSVLHGAWEDQAKEIERLQAQLDYDAKIKDGRMETGRYKLYYCDSENSYLLGARVDNFYYAHWHCGLGFVWDMSRYLPWGETIDGHEHGCAWGVHTYPSEPREIGECEWFKGFISQRTREAAEAAQEEQKG